MFRIRNGTDALAWLYVAVLLVFVCAGLALAFLGVRWLVQWALALFTLVTS